MDKKLIWSGSEGEVSDLKKMVEDSEILDNLQQQKTLTQEVEGTEALGG